MRCLVLLWLSLCLALSLASCQLLPAHGLVYQVAGGSYQLSSGWPGKPQQLLQQVQFKSATTTQQFLLSVQMLPEQLLLVALSPVGHELWRVQLSADGQLQHQGVAPFSERTFALRLLAEMQWSLWPVAQIQPRLQGLQLTEQAGLRQVLDPVQQQAILQISGGGVLAVGQVTVLQQADYQLTLTTLEQEFL
jgi:hypothetical protein